MYYSLLVEELKYRHIPIVSSITIRKTCVTNYGGDKGLGQDLQDLLK